jgi:hypothetical protein
VIHPALRYLLVRQSIGGIRYRISRLRNPRYLVILLMGLGYFWLTFGMPWMMPTREGKPAMELAPVLRMFVGPAFGLFISMGLLTSPSRPAPPFTLPEAAQLFVLPLSRRELVRYRLLRPQIAYLLMACVGALLSLRARDVNMLYAGVAVFTLLNIVWLSTMASALLMNRMREAGWPKLTFYLPGLLLLAYIVLPVLPSATPPGETPILEWAESLLTGGIARYVHAPLHLLGALPGASGFADFAAGAAMAVAICAALFGACMALAGPFEEQSTILAERTGVQLDAVRRGGLMGLKLSRLKHARSTGIALASTGAPWIAVFWLTLVGEWRAGSWRVLSILSGLMLLCVGAFAVVGVDRHYWIVVAMFAGIMAFPLAIMAPRLLVTGMQTEVRRLELWKALPLRGYLTLRGKVWAGALLLAFPLTALATSGGAAAMFLADEGTPWLLPSILAGAPVMIAVAALMVALESAVILMLPAWTVTTQGEAAIEQVGRNLVSLVVRFVVGAFMLIIPTAIGVIVGLIFVLMDAGGWAAAPGALAGAAALAGEVELLLLLIGLRYDRMDVSEAGT